MTYNHIKNNFQFDHANLLNRRKIIALIQAAADNYAGGLLLDMGCGAKQYSELFTGKAERYLGLDLRLAPFQSDDKIGPDILASALRSPLPDNRFDTIIS